MSNKPNDTALTSVESRALVALALLYVLRMLGLFMVLPVLTLYSDNYIGATPALIGLALGIYGLSQAAMQIPMGMLSDKIGRKPVIVIGLLLFALGSAIAANANSIEWLIFGRVVQGMGAIAGTVTALLADVTRESQRSKAMAILGISIGMSFGIALIIGPMIASLYGVAGLFWATALFALLSIVVVLLFVPTPTRLSTNPETSSLPAQLGRCLQDSNLRRLDGGVFFLHFLLMAMFIALPQLLVGHGLPLQEHWEVYLPVMLLSFVVMMPLMMRAERAGKVREMVLLSIAVLGIASLAAALSYHSFLALIFAVGLFFVAFNMLEANLPSLLSKTVFPGGRGTAMGIYSTAQFFGAFLGGSLGGWAAAQAGAVGVFALCAGAAFLWLVLAWPMVVPKSLDSHVVELATLAGIKDASGAGSHLAALPGVVDVTVFAEQGLAYLRVDDSFDKAMLAKR